MENNKDDMWGNRLAILYLKQLEVAAAAEQGKLEESEAYKTVIFFYHTAIRFRHTY